MKIALEECQRLFKEVQQVLGVDCVASGAFHPLDPSHLLTNNAPPFLDVPHGFGQSAVRWHRSDSYPFD